MNLNVKLKIIIIITINVFHLQSQYKASIGTQIHKVHLIK